MQNIEAEQRKAQAMVSSVPVREATRSGKLSTPWVDEPSQIGRHEWAWLVTVSSVLVLLSLLPLLLAAAGTPHDWQFMGIAHNYEDAATYLAKMRIGFEGDWLVSFRHTAELHDGALIVLLYPMLGHVARITGLDLLVVYHLARVTASLIMYISLYRLGATLWTKVSSRRLFFFLVSVASGLGWLIAPLTGQAGLPDLAIPEVFPFYSSLVNPHFPLAIAALALLAGRFVLLIRPCRRHWNLWDGLLTALLSLALALLYPQALVPFAVAVVLKLLVLRWHAGEFPPQTLLHTAALILPAIPVALYLLVVVRVNPAMAEWNRQNVTLSPPLWAVAAGLGLPLLLGLPATIRAARHMDRDGDRLMLLWLIAIVAAMFFPMSLQRRFAVGLMIPVAFFAVRALLSYWLPRLQNRAGRLALAALFVLMPVSTLMITFFPVLPLLAGLPEERLGFVLPAGYSEAMDWLAANERSEPVLAAPEVSTWIPARSRHTVVYGHPFETLHADEKKAQVEAWYALPVGDDGCASLLETHAVGYVVFGPVEAALGEGGCLSGQTPIFSSGEVSVYAVSAR